MTDFLSPSERSERMSRIKGKDTGPELALRKSLHRLGLRFRLNDTRLPGKPDIVFPRYRVIVFVHGCFWHRHKSCKIASTPKSNILFWLDKFEKNIKRDARIAAELESKGWKVVIVWECELASKTKNQATAQRLYELIRHPSRTET